MPGRPFILLLALLTFAMTACAPSPVVDIEAVQSVVAHAYASGAARYAPGEYQLASSALRAAEQQLANNEPRKALRTLELARRYATESLNITLKRKQKMLAEQQRQAEQQRRAELERQRQRQLEQQAEILQRRQEEAQRAREAKQRAEEERHKAAELAREKESQPPPPKPPPVTQIQVQAGENLATIAARPEVYQDALLWPLIYKANRDQIKNPSEIYAGQVLIVPRDATDQEREKARADARESGLF